jgi:hypothetical protein
VELGTAQPNASKQDKTATKCKGSMVRVLSFLLFKGRHKIK